MVDSASKSVRLRELDVREQRRVALASVVRCALLVAVLLVLYSVWPFESAPDVSWDLGVLVLASVVFVWVLVRQVRHIVDARLPELRAVEAVVVSITLFVVLVSGCYLYLSTADPAAFSEPLNRINALYFTVTVFTTVGFGDIHAATGAAQASVTAQMVLDVVLIGIVVRVLVAAARKTLAVASAPAGPGPAD